MTERETVLIVEDEEDMREACAQALAALDLEVLAAANGEEGLRLVRERVPDLVFVDIKMAGMDGMTLLSEIRKFDPTIVTVVITGFATVDSAVEAMRQGAYDFLPKPFTPEQLREVARRGLERRRLAAAAQSLREERERVRNNLISLVSHELRAPLVAVDQYLEVLLGGVAGDLTPEQREILSQARARVEHLLDLVKDWLAVGRVAQAGVAQRAEPVDLVRLLRQVCEAMQGVAERAGVTVTFVEPPFPAEVTGDAEALMHVFTNLVSNGIQYNREGGSVTVEVLDEEDKVCVFVSDTGIGIPQESIPFIFDEFFRGDDRRVRSKPGSGLGLALVRSIVTAHQGSVTVDSTPEVGTTFIVTLPKRLKPEGVS